MNSKCNNCYIITYMNNPLDDPQHLHSFLFNLFDFAEYLLTKTPPTRDQDDAFVIMAYIEDLMDSYGRQLISNSAKDAGLNPDESLKSANHRLDMLRAALDGAFWKNPHNDSKELHLAADEAARRLQRNWGTRE